MDNFIIFVMKSVRRGVKIANRRILYYNCNVEGERNKNIIKKYKDVTETILQSVTFALNHFPDCFAKLRKIFDITITFLLKNVKK